jgi:hypothetical protein
MHPQTPPWQTPLAQSAPDEHGCATQRLGLAPAQAYDSSGQSALDRQATGAHVPGPL